MYDPRYPQQQNGPYPTYEAPYDPYAQPYAQSPGYPQYPQFTQGNPGYGYDGYGYPPPTPEASHASPQGAKRGSRKKSGGSPGGGGNGDKKRRSFKWQLIKLLLVLVAIAAAVIGAQIWTVRNQVEPYASVFLDNITVDGINLGGKTWAEGSAAVWAQANEKQSSWYVRLKNASGEFKDITAETLGISFDPSAALEQAWAIGHNSSGGMDIFQLKATIDEMKAGGAAFHSAETNADTSPIDSILVTLEHAAYVEPQDAQITGFYPEDSLNPFSFQAEKWGQKLDVAAIQEQILQMVQTYQSGEIVLMPEPLAPSITVADLEKTVSLRFRAITPIDKHSTENRNNNIRHAFSKINGMVLENDQKFSFNNVVGRRTEKNGYFPAVEYSYGELVEGIGGGVCQASTTVFLAAVQAGLKIEKLKMHGTPVSYTDLGKDATVSDTKGREIDFVFRNNSGAPIYLLASVITDPSNKNRLLCEVKIYGHSLENVRYELESDILETIPMPTEPERIKDTKGTYAIYSNEEVVVRKATEGHVVDTYLCTIIDGVQVEREKIATTTYPARTELIYYGAQDVYVAPQEDAFY